MDEDSTYVKSSIAIKKHAKLVAEKHI